MKYSNSFIKVFLIIFTCIVLVSCGDKTEVSESTVTIQSTIDDSFVLPIKQSDMKVVDYAKNDNKKKIKNKVVSCQDGATTYVLMENGDLYGYGNNGNHIISQFVENDVNIDKPYRIMKNVKKVIYVGGRAICLQNDGSLWLWGTGPSEPKKVEDNVKDFYNDYYGLTLYIKNNGELWTGATFADKGTMSGKKEKVLDNVERLSENQNYAITKDDFLWDLSGERENGGMKYSPKKIIGNVKTFYGDHYGNYYNNHSAFVIKKDNTL